MLHTVEAEITHRFVCPINTVGLPRELTITKIHKEPSGLRAISLHNSIEWFTISSQVSERVRCEPNLIVLIDLSHEGLWSKVGVPNTNVEQCLEFLDSLCALEPTTDGVLIDIDWHLHWLLGILDADIYSLIGYSSRNSRPHCVNRLNSLMIRHKASLSNSEHNISKLTVEASHSIVETTKQEL